ncbi:MAG TPA: hypothetical protein VGS27_22435 [Candidatus Sulfotelmatobacter sp.]|nr:hypothetical protein [Candidatus Sulfotelmatobacter sp.]
MDSSKPHDHGVRDRNVWPEPALGVERHRYGGLVVGEIFSDFLFMNFGWKALAFTPIGNALFGFLIELFTTKVFKAPALARAVPRIVEHPVAA